MINTIQIALSGLHANSKKVEASAANIANMTSSGRLSGEGQQPYSAVTTVQEATESGGVKTTIVAKNPPFTPAYDPGSPLADENGTVGVPNVDLAEEAVNMSVAKAAYKANIATLKTADEMQQELLRALDRKV